jgi:hypothetical protein
MGLAAALAAVIFGPTALYVADQLRRQVIKGDPIVPCPPFHSVISGKSRMGEGDPADAEMWYSGHAVAFRGFGLNLIEWLEGPLAYEFWKPDGKLQKRRLVWARGGNLTADEFRLMTRRNAPLPPVAGSIIGKPENTALNRKPVVRTTYQLVQKKNPDVKSVEFPTKERLYLDVASGHIVRTEFIATFPSGQTQTEVHDFTYERVPESVFEPSTLAPTQTTMPAMKGPERVRSAPAKSKP